MSETFRAKKRLHGTKPILSFLGANRRPDLPPALVKSIFTLTHKQIQDDEKRTFFSAGFQNFFQILTLEQNVVSENCLKSKV
jgi:hypothetical protein